ncbi:SUPPRESSOR OF GAMMA RESPONSE 1-like [Heracleum sosnowskyi]|uniref:SUPPRESSOR OF GAMMA RESPONSE 1-like n=1 Tax=Heracleum sosnowskyi TaxID=360622 RepID=A0AAD8IDS4_9APIA|nr:SUPPRESSOR OF GAMMA RESPONSE 1-like [Heracleum sosnowskyi]
MSCLGMEAKTEAILPTDVEMIEPPECLLCANCRCNKQVLQEWTNLPAGVKFDPTDVELLDHLAAKCGIGNRRSNMFVDRFIITLQGEGGICYTHPENLPGTKKDGSNAHYFYKSMNAYASGKRKRRKIQSEDSVRWHKTGKTKPVMENGVTKGYKKILVLYSTTTNGSKSVKSNWVMHQYHLGTEDDENEGEYVVSKVFYQQRHVKKVGNSIAKEDSVHLVEDIASPNKKEDSNTENDIKIDIVQTPAQEVEIIKKIPHTSPSGSLSMLETEFPSWFAGEICKPSSSCKGDMLSGMAGMTQLENNRVDSPVYSDFFKELQHYLDEQENWKDEVQSEHKDVS